MTSFWAIVELLGHVRTAGLVSEVEMFGTKLGRVDTPGKNGWIVTQYFSGASIYRISPCTEETARIVAASNEPAPVSPWDVRRALEAHKDGGAQEGEIPW